MLDRSRVGFLLALLVFLVDLAVVPRHILAYRDSLDLVTSSYLLQAAHPPGYPLFIVISKLLTLPLAFIPEIYTRYAIVNSFYGSLAVLLLYKCGLLLTATSAEEGEDGGDVLLSALAALGFAWSYSFWLYRLIPEVFMMAILASMLSLWLLLRWRAALAAASDSARRWWIAFAVSLGLGIVCHPITVLWWPAFIIVWLATAEENWVSQVVPAAIGLTVGLLPTLLVYLLAFLPHPPMWGNQPTLHSLVTFFMRSDYGGPTSAGPVGEASQQFRQWPMHVYFSSFWFNFGPLVYLTPVGLWLCLRYGERYLSFLPLTWLLAGPVFLTYGGYRTDSPFYLGSVETFYLPSFVAFVLMMLVCIERALRGRPAFMRRALAAVLTVMVGAALVLNFPRVDRHDHTFSESFSRALLEGLPPNAILVVRDDHDIFVAAYEIWAAKRRPDLVLLNYGFVHKPGYQAEFAALYPDVKITNSLIPSIFMRHFLADNIAGKRRIFLATLAAAHAWGCDGNPYFLRPKDKVFEVVRSNRDIPKDPAVLPVAPEITHNFADTDYWDHALIVAYRLAWKNLGVVYTRLGLYGRARALYSQMIALDPHEPTWAASLHALQGKPDTFKPRDDSDYRPADAASYDLEGLSAIKARDFDTAAADLDMAQTLAPNNAQYANQLGAVMLGWHDYAEALPHLQRAVQLEPGNKKYLDDLDLARRNL